MTTPQQFGEYLLFRRLTADGLGETFRAGKIGNQGIERVVLLRLFNGAGIDADTLWRTIADRMGLHRILQNPHIGDGADVGRVGSTPYVAYEYVSGKNLAELLSQARARAFQIPTEHALFIMERITFGLSAAFSTRHRDQRVQHGFLVPETVLLSNEGEVRLIGFESAPGLRNFLKAAPIRESFGPYLAPDVTPGTDPTPTDDVFSLGSLLYELLTGSRLVHSPEGNFDGLVDEAVLAAEEQPLPPSLRALLKSSLAPRAQRVGDVQQWQQAFGRFIAEANYSPTTFNLAFFMHTLFGGEIEQETLDIAREKATHVDVAALAQIDEPTPGPSDTVLIPPVRESRTLRQQDEAADAPEAGTYRGARYGGAKRKGANWRVLAPVLILALAGALAIAYYWSTGRKPSAEIVQARTNSSEATDTFATEAENLGLESDVDAALEDSGAGTAQALGVPPEPATAEFDAVDVSGVDVPPTPDEVEAQIDRLVRDRADTLEARYEEELAALRRQLEEARLAQQPGTQAPPVDAQSAQTAATSESPTTVSGQETTPKPPPSGLPAAKGGDSGTGASGTGASGTVNGAESSVAEEAAPGIRESVEAAPPAAATPEAVVPTPPALGDLVEVGPGVVRPELTSRPQPRYPAAARRLSKRADVQLRVLVDENGNVAQVERLGAAAGFGFDEAAEAAARQTRWVAATKLGVRVKMWVDLKISFRP